MSVENDAARAAKSGAVAARVRVLTVYDAVRAWGGFMLLRRIALQPRLMECALAGAVYRVVGWSAEVI